MSPKFTPSKQLEVIMVLAQIRDFHTVGQWCSALNSSEDEVEYRNEQFSQCVAGLINLLWQDLTEDEKQKIREILK